ncbi:MAG: hypothetical protein IIV10_03860 [Alistipes sp.]|nr:hypothetical protein [Alistipes sp.]
MAAELPKKCCCGKKYLLLYRVILQRFASAQINYLQNNFAILKINSIFVAQIKKTTT